MAGSPMALWALLQTQSAAWHYLLLHAYLKAGQASLTQVAQEGSQPSAAPPTLWPAQSQQHTGQKQEAPAGLRASL